MFEDKTYKNVLDRMLGRVSAKFDKREGSVIWDTLSPTALEFAALYIELERIISETYGDTASREFLILRCKERGIEPYPATHTILKGNFTPVSLDVTGKRFNIGEQNYVVAEKISDGVYKVQCEEPGRVGNQLFGAMVPIEYIPGLETAELVELLTPGEDEEATEDLRQRYFDSFNETAFGGNRKDYIDKANAIPGVGCTKVTRVWNSDIRPAEMIPNSVVASWYEDFVKNTTDESVKDWLTAVYSAAADKKLTVGGAVLLTVLNSEYAPASDVLIEDIQKRMDPEKYAGEGYGIAPIGHIVKVQSADPVLIYVNITIEFADGYSWSNSSVFISEIISNYLLELRKEWAGSDNTVVRISQIESRILSFEGVKDITRTSINGEQSNLILGIYQVPVFGGVSVQ